MLVQDYIIESTKD